MIFAEPDYPNIVLSFEYRGFIIQIDESLYEGQILYAAWADYAYGCAVAVPFAPTRRLAVREARRWVDRRISLNRGSSV
ncbi:MAG: hypothetical protein AAGF66_09175 [Cyanobacteria bacterium P01_H01_bin.119]